MKNQCPKNILFFIGSLVFTSFSAIAMDIQIFTDHAHPVRVEQVHQPVDLSYYNLDQLKNIVYNINAIIHGQSATEARQNAKQLIQKYKMQLNQATEGIKLVNQYGIKEIPTIVFNGGVYQIKGQTDLQTAIQEYQQWKKHTK